METIFNIPLISKQILERLKEEAKYCPHFNLTCEDCGGRPAGCEYKKIG